jgi:hypothetical protein
MTWQIATLQGLYSRRGSGYDDDALKSCAAESTGIAMNSYLRISFELISGIRRHLNSSCHSTESPGPVGRRGLKS